MGLIAAQCRICVINNAELADKGFFVTASDDLINWAHRLADVDDIFGLACCAVEMMQASMPRWGSRALRLCAARLAAPIGRDDRRGHVVQQDGAGAPEGL